MIAQWIWQHRKMYFSVENLRMNIFHAQTNYKELY